MTIDTSKYSTETKIAGLEAILSLVLSTLTADERIKLATNGLELMKILKNQPESTAIRGQDICEYMGDLLNNSINLD
ncbi:hypothetical protein [Serratia liquefaciens]|uniref:hypothetical protein n=1 Tax=Serratia liquefaciens TaxID=614 RepID=UPI0035260BC2